MNRTGADTVSRVEQRRRRRGREVRPAGRPGSRARRVSSRQGLAILCHCGALASQVQESEIDWLLRPWAPCVARPLIGGDRAAMVRAPRRHARRPMGRSQVVRQRILIPPFPGSSPGAPASKSRLMGHVRLQKSAGLSRKLAKRYGVSEAQFFWIFGRGGHISRDSLWSQIFDFRVLIAQTRFEPVRYLPLKCPSI